MQEETCRDGDRWHLQEDKGQERTGIEECMQ